MPRPEKSKNTLDYSLTLNNLYIALYENNNNPYTKAGAVFGFRGTLTGEPLDRLLDQSRSEEEATKQETQPFMAADDYSSVINLYSRKDFGYSGSQKRFFIAHLGGWRSAKATLSQKTDVIFNGNSKADGGVRTEFWEDFGSWKCYTDDSGNYIFFRADDYIGKTQPEGTRSIAEYIVSCNYHLISQYCERKERLKEVICAFAENMEDDERKRSGKKGLNNLYDEHQEEIRRLKDCLEKLILTYENSDNTMEKDWSLARALSYLVIGAMLRETMSCKLIEENFEEYLPKWDMTGLGKDLSNEDSIKGKKNTLSEFDKALVLKCYTLVKDYLHSDSIEDPDEYSTLWCAIKDMRPLLPSWIYEKIFRFLETKIEPITENYSELFITPLLKSGVGTINKSGFFELHSDDEAIHLVAHFYKIIFDIEDEFDGLIKEIIDH